MSDAVQVTVVSYCDDLTDAEAETTPFGIVGETKDIRFFVFALPLVGDNFTAEMLLDLPKLFHERLTDPTPGFGVHLRGTVHTQTLNVPDVLHVEKDDYFTGRWWPKALTIFAKHVAKAPRSHLITYSIMRTPPSESSPAPLHH